MVALTGDEEEAGKPRTIARRDLIAEGKRADVALDFEGLVRLNGQDMGSIARRSSNTWTLKTSGETGHSSSIFSERMGDGAVFELARPLLLAREGQQGERGNDGHHQQGHDQGHAALAGAGKGRARVHGR